MYKLMLSSPRMDTIEQLRADLLKCRNVMALSRVSNIPYHTIMGIRKGARMNPSHRIVCALRSGLKKKLVRKPRTNNEEGA